MKLKDSFKEYDKEMMHNLYAKLVDKFKDYDKITKPKMIEEIIKSINDPLVIMDLCTEKELYLLKQIKEKKVNVKTPRTKELINLWQKCLLIDGTYEFPEELEKNINIAIDNIDWSKARENDRINELSIGYLKCMGDMITFAFTNLMSQLLQIEEKELDNFYATNKLFKYYIYRDEKYIDSLNSTVQTFVYDNYLELIDELGEQRKIYGSTSLGDFDIENFISMFYFDININNSKVKKLYDLIYKIASFPELIISSVAESALLFEERDSIEYFFLMACDISDKNKDKYLKILNEAMDEIPSGALNGCKPIDYYKIKEEEKEYKEYRRTVNELQVNACLHPNDANLFYKLYFGLLEYTNKVYNVKPDLKIYKNKYLNPQDINPVIEKLWENSNDVIDDFLQLNPYRFNKYELSVVQDFKKGMHKSFVVAKFEQEYTIILDDDKAYMVKGLNSNIDTVIAPSKLPYFVTTTLLPFKNLIIYDGIFSAYDISIGMNYSKHIEDEINNKIKYYHL